jgi:hypothetical protein
LQHLAWLIPGTISNHLDKVGEPSPLELAALEQHLNQALPQCRILIREQPPAATLPAKISGKTSNN